MVQYPVPVVKGPEDIQVQVEQICRAVASTKAGYPDLDLIVFPEYSTQGLNTAIWTYDEMLLTIDSPEVDRFKKACRDNDVWGVFSVMERNDNPALPPFNTALIINADGEIALHYRKLQPWVPIEPWAPGNYGMPECDGPKGSRLAVCICHDGMFPELAREAADKGANVYIRISGVLYAGQRPVDLDEPHQRLAKPDVHHLHQSRRLRWRVLLLRRRHGVQLRRQRYSAGSLQSLGDRYRRTVSATG